MPDNVLTLQGSNEFRDFLLTKNLPPYSVQNVFAPNEQGLGQESELSSSIPQNVQDSLSVSVDVEQEAKAATLFNKYGTSEILDGAELISNPITDLTVSQSEYVETNLDVVNEASINAIAVLNGFTPDDEYNDLFIVTDNILAKDGYSGVYPKFIQQTYSLIDVVNFDFNQNNLRSGNGSDSYLQQLGIRFLNKAFQDRIDEQIRKNTIGRVNLDAFTNPWDVALLATGQESLVQKNWSITVPDGVFDQAKYLTQKIAGTVIPASPIEGDYFNEPPNQNLSLRQLIDKTFSSIYKPADPKNNPSEKFLNNTGSGQKSVLFNLLGYNTFKPDYDTNRTQIGVVIDNLFDRNNSLTNFYVGGSVSDPTSINAPQNLSPVNYLGKQTSSVVLGPDTIAKEYEYKNFDGTDIVGGISQIDFGLRAKNLDDGGYLDSGFVWTQKPTTNIGGVTQKVMGDNIEAGKNVGTSIDGGADYNRYGTNPLFQGLSTQSSNLEFKGGSILDETQRLIDSAPVSGKNRLKHAGNAINQLSKVFDDGYKQLTKGSKVRKFRNISSGQYVGEEYARIFSKDKPYYFRQNLQQTVATDNGSDINGNIRKSNYSVLDSTSNLNIVPNKGVDSTNIRDGRVKKYMFSIENLSWINTPEYEDLPDCEKGPNGGRVMWFPPYNLTFDDSSSPQFNATNFLGRPEPIYTYQHTTRSGSLSWSIVVDHPSVLNLIVNKELANISDDTTVQQIVDSFFAGVQKYDIYELAKKFNTVPLSDLQTLYNDIIASNKTSSEQKEQASNAIGVNGSELPTNSNNLVLQNDPDGYGFYFDDVSLIGSDISQDPFSTLYDNYILLQNRTDYSTQLPTQSAQTLNFFEQVIVNNFLFISTNFINEITELLNNKTAKVKILLRGSQFFDSTNYVYTNQKRLDSIKLWFGSFILPDGTTTLQKYIDSQELTFELSQIYAENVVVNGFGEVNCIEALTGPEKIYSTTAMACRSLRMKVTLTPNTPAAQSSNNNPAPDNLNNGTKPKETQSIEAKSKSISKFLLRKLLSECDYFNALKSEDSLVFDTIRKKIRHFNPAFHSMTPEGLNARLTFLNQCVRPGRTIPTQTKDGETVIVDAFNTNFGTPPILVLRVGDFYHTKIVPKSLTFKYESLDLNPQGIGVQPMVANVSLGFEIIGGMGLKEPFDKLQNSLTFNYYANTEMYDDRSDITEDVEAIDSDLIQALQNKPNPNQVTQNGTEGGGFIGNIISSTITNGITTGTVNYNTFFNNVISETQTYFNSVANKLLDINNTYNYGILTQISSERDFSVGYINNLKSPELNFLNIYGKPVFWQEHLQSVGNKASEDVDSLENPILVGLTAYTFQEVNRQVLKTNIKNMITDKVNNGYSSLQQKIEDLSVAQSNYYQFLRKMDFVCFSGDGKTNSNNSPFVISLSGTSNDSTSNTMNQMISDYITIWSDLKNYYDLLVSKNIIVDSLPDYGFSAKTPAIQSSLSQQVFYTLFSDDMLPTSKIESCVDKLCENINSIIFKNKIRNIVVDLALVYRIEKSDGDYFLSTDWANQDTQIYKNYNPTDTFDGTSLNTRDRLMEFSNQNISETYYEEFKKLYISVNSNNDPTTFVGKKTFN